MLSGDKVADILQWTWPVEGIHGNNIFKLIGVQANQDVPDPARFKLKDSVRLATLKKAQGCWIIIWNLARGKIRVLLANKLTGLRQN